MVMDVCGCQGGAWRGRACAAHCPGLTVCNTVPAVACVCRLAAGSDDGHVLLWQVLPAVSGELGAAHSYDAHVADTADLRLAEPKRIGCNGNGGCESRADLP